MRKKQIFVFLISAFILSSFQFYKKETNLQQKTQISAAFQYSLLLHKDKVWLWGKHQNFQGKHQDLINPTLTANISDVTYISEGASANHILAIKQDKTVWAWGKNTYGQLATFESEHEPFPLKIKGLNNIVQVTVGRGHSVALKADGTVWTWGWNKYGQLGLGNTNNQTKVRKIPNLNNIVSISAGAKHTLALDKDGNVWSWGANHLGQLGLGKDQGSIRPEKIVVLKNIKQISAGSYHNIALGKDGKIFTWGWNDFGQIGNNTTVNWRVPVYIPLGNVTSVKAGTLHNLVLKKDGTVWAWGDNTFSQCGNFNSKRINIPRYIPTLKNITQFSAGDIHSVALDRNGDVWSWGSDENGRLGHHYTNQIFTPSVAFNLDDLKENTKFTGLEVGMKTILAKAATIEIFGLKQRKNEAYHEIPVDNYIVDTMYHSIKIGDDVLLDKCPTEQALKKLDIHLQSSDKESILLSWKLENEDDFYINFFVEKSIDGVNWKELEADLVILQDSEVETVFTTTDNNVNVPNIFYRLKQLNCDGNYVYSNIIRTDKWLNHTEGIFASKFTVSINNPTEQLITYQLQDLDGNIVQKKMLSDKKIAFTDGLGLKDGVYFMFLIDEKLHHIIDYKKITKISKE